MIINGLRIFENKKFEDDRGYFIEVMNRERCVEKKESFEFLLKKEYVQENESMSNKNVIRGLHFQLPKQQAKLIRVIKGKILDVCVDLRPWSKTYLLHSKIELSEYNNKMLYVPMYFAHGFLSLENETIVNYKCTTSYDPKGQYGIRWDDERLGIKWGIDSKNAILSNKDSELPNLEEALGNYLKQINATRSKNG